VSARELPYDVIADTFARTLAGVRDDQWSLPTPCEDWDVAQLVGHVVATHWRVYALCGEPGRPADGTEIDLRDAFTEATDAMRRAAHDPVLSQVEVQGRAGTQTFAQLARHDLPQLGPRARDRPGRDARPRRRRHRL